MMEEWNGGMMEEWNGGMMEEWKNGTMEWGNDGHEGSKFIEPAHMYYKNKRK